MSVFSQLMMKKRGSKIFINPKLVAVGDGITIDNGIATSSDNSYLKMDYIFDINHYNTWKFKTKVYFKSLNGNIFANINQDQVGFRIGTDSAHNRYYMLISISKGNWNRNVSSPNNSAVTNVWTWIEAEYTGTNYILRTSTDGETWTEQINVAMGTKASNGDSSVYGFFGSGIPGSTEFLNGYIDLMETKLYANGELWFECANDTGIFTLPLTKVGSPTITDGVVSGLTDKQNTVETMYSIDVGDNAWELQLNILNPTKASIGLFRTNNNNNTRTTLTSAYGIASYLNYSLNSDNPLRATDLADYWNSLVNSAPSVFIKFSCSGKDANNKYPITIGISTDGNTWQSQSFVSDVTLASGVIMFASTYGSYATGTSAEYDLNLNNSYFAIAGTKYKFVIA